MNPDEHVAVLVKLAEHYEKAVKFFREDIEAGHVTTLYRERAAAIRWVLSLNAYGVEEHEVVT